MKTTGLKNLNDLNDTILLQDYVEKSAKTDKFSDEYLCPILLGLYGEVGSIMAASKKYRREGNAYPSYKEEVEEEFGDALWYLSALCKRMNIEMAELFELVSRETRIKIISANNDVNTPNSQAISTEQVDRLESSLIELGYVVAQILKIKKDSPNVRGILKDFVRQYLKAIQITDLSFDNVLNRNLTKICGRFLYQDKDKLPDFDKNFPKNEQLPRQFKIHINQQESGRSQLCWNGKIIGSPLSDNISEPDGYRFHDVFHLANASILHWSPTFRALIKRKRKSDPNFDEEQDGGRAIAIEEGLSAWLFSYSKGLNYFHGHDSISFDALKTIQKFVQGFEVDQCPLKLWEDAILQGYEVFRQVKKHNGGIIIGNRENRTIEYRPLVEK